eukprot:m.454161 g.454161  ORF g.454161 m.454161 type:complete len:279 (+) comp56947_c0_seq1:4273-5109(+)
MSFENAGLTRVWLFTIVGLTIARVSPLASLLPDSRMLQVVLHHVAPDEVFTMLVCSILIYTFQSIERRFSSRKYAMTLVCLVALSQAVQLGLRIWQSSYEGGPALFSVLFGLAYLVFRDVPSQRTARILGIPVSQKSSLYLLLLQLLTGSRATVAAALSGVVCRIRPFPCFVQFLSCWTRSDSLTVLQVSGAVYRRFLRSLAFPAWMADSLAPIFQARHRAAAPQLQAEDPQQMFRSQVHQARIDQLINLGFTREQVMQALTIAGNDMEVAASILLGQ